VTDALLSPELMRRLDQLAVRGRRPRRGVMTGDRRSPGRGASVEFADFRPYAPGDDFRQVDWNAYARLERFFLKLFVAEEDATVHLLVDTSRSMAWGAPAKLDFARRVAAAVGYVALTSLDWVALSAFADAPAGHPRPRRGRAAVPGLLAGLAALEADGGTDLVGAVRRHAAATRRPGPLVLLSDLYDTRWREALRAALASRFDVTVIQVLSPEEIAPDLEGDFRLVDDETGEAVEISADGDALALYRAQLDIWQADVRGWCRGHGVPYLSVASDFPLDAFVIDVLRRHGVVG
jgi:uncharacterized protein (DUF58 family)